MLDYKPMQVISTDKQLISTHSFESRILFVRACVFEFLKTTVS